MNPELQCRDGVRLLGAYMDGLLEPGVRRDLEHHVSGCVRCRRFVRSYREVPRIFRKATATTTPERLKRSLHRLTARLTAARER
jgi:anti-sigma factor RsiW